MCASGLFAAQPDFTDPAVLTKQVTNSVRAPTNGPEPATTTSTLVRSNGVGSGSGEDPLKAALQRAASALPGTSSNQASPAAGAGSKSPALPAAIETRTASKFPFADPASLAAQAATNTFRASTNIPQSFATNASVASHSRVGPASGTGSNVVVSQSATNVQTGSATNSMEALDDAHNLAIGDRLSFRILEDEEDPRPLTVTDSGDLEVPYIGRFPGVGKTCKELAFALKRELEKEYYYQATVIVAVDVMTRSRGRVYLVGPVRMPGPQEIPSDETLTLSKAILRAGGFGDFANKRHVRVTRKGGGANGEDVVYTVDVGEILEKGQTESDLVLKAGDLIYIPERSIRF